MNEQQKQYYQKLAQDAGFDESQTSALMEALGNEKFGQGIVPRPEFSRGLDAEREKAEAAQAERDKIVNEWYPQAKEAERQFKAGLDRLRLYEQTYGELPNNLNRQQRTDLAAATGLSKEDVDSLLQERLDALKREFDERQARQVEFEDIRAAHRDEFGKPLNTDAFVEFVDERKKAGKYESLASYHRDFVAEERETLRKQHRDEEVKRLVDEQMRDFKSKHHIPSDPRPSEPHLLHDHERLKAESGKEDAQSGRDAFLQTMSAPDGSWKDE